MALREIKGTPGNHILSDVIEDILNYKQISSDQTRFRRWSRDVNDAETIKRASVLYSLILLLPVITCNLIVNLH